MKFATAKEHRDFFQKNGWIEFEDLLSEDQINRICHVIDSTLCKRLQTSEHSLRLQPSDQLFLQGRDLWRTDGFLKEIVLQKRLAEIAIELIEKKSLRLAFDQYFSSDSQSPLEQTELSYLDFFKQTSSLEGVSCIQGVACGWLFAIEGNQTTLEPLSTTEGADIFPKRKGGGVFFKADLPIQWNIIHQLSGMRYYLIAYANSFARYILQPRDPHTHTLKRLGYIFNDKLNDNLHPVVMRLN